VDALADLADTVPPALFRAAHARASSDVGRRQEACARLATRAAAGFANLRDWSQLAELSNWSEVAAGSGNRDAIDLLHELLLPWSAQVICTRTHVAGAVAHYLGMLEGARGDHVAAEVHFAEALELHERFEAPFHIARTHVEWARMLLGLPRSTALARRHLDLAIDLARAAGCGFVLATAEQLRTEAGRSATISRRTRRSSWTGRPPAGSAG
jgi:hypothetical protein